MSKPRVSIISLGCSRNDVDSEELAGRLTADGWHIADETEATDVVMVNTCGFIEQAKKDSIDVLLQAMDGRDAGQSTKVVAVGCMAQRYGKELHEALPEADAILSFDDYSNIGATLREVLAGNAPAAHTPVDRRTLLPITPIDRVNTADAIPGMGPHVYRTRLTSEPWAPLKIASGCDRRCTFCAIPAFRGSYVSRSPAEILAEAQWLSEQGVKEALLVSENSTSYGKDLGNLRLLEELLPALAQQSGLPWIRVSYLQPAEIRPDLVRIIAQTPGVVPYFDLSFQHSSAQVLRRMKRFGNTESFLDLLAVIRALNPAAGTRTNVIVGFPGETSQDVDELVGFLESAQLDAIGVFAYSDEEGTAAVKLDDHVSEAEIADRFTHVSAIAQRMCDAVANSRIGSQVTVLIDGPDNSGRAEHQGPEVDGSTTILADRELVLGEMVTATVVAADGIDLIAQLNQSNTVEMDTSQISGAQVNQVS